MANEVRVVEHQGQSNSYPIMEAPFLAVQTLSIGGAVSAAFTKSTKSVSIITSVACQIEFSNVNGTAPNGAGAGSGVIVLPANTYLNFNVKGGMQVIAVA